MVRGLGLWYLARDRQRMPDALAARLVPSRVAPRRLIALATDVAVAPNLVFVGRIEIARALPSLLEVLPLRVLSA